MPAKNSPKPPTQREQIAELREQVSALIAAMQVVSPQPEVKPEAKPEELTTEARRHGEDSKNVRPLALGPRPSALGLVIALISVACIAFQLWSAFGPTAEKLPAHKATLVQSRLIAVDVLGEVEAQIERCEEAEEPFTAEQLKAILLDRCPEACSAAWEPVMESINDLQDEDGSIDCAKARAMVSKTRKGLEAVR